MHRSRRAGSSWSRPSRRRPGRRRTPTKPRATTRRAALQHVGQAQADRHVGQAAGARRRRVPAGVLGRRRACRRRRRRSTAGVDAGRAACSMPVGRRGDAAALGHGVLCGGRGEPGQATRTRSSGTGSSTTPSRGRRRCPTPRPWGALLASASEPPPANCRVLRRSSETNPPLACTLHWLGAARRRVDDTAPSTVTANRPTAAILIRPLIRYPSPSSAHTEDSSAFVNETGDSAEPCAALRNNSGLVKPPCERPPCRAQRRDRSAVGSAVVPYCCAACPPPTSCCSLLGGSGCRHLQRRGRRRQPDLVPDPARAGLPGPHGEHHQHHRDLARLPGLGRRLPQRDRRPVPPPRPPDPRRPGRRRRRRAAPAHDVRRRPSTTSCPGSSWGPPPCSPPSRCCGGPWTGAPAHPRTRPVLLVAGVFAASVYGGYFGAAMGVMFLAVLGLALPLSLAHTSGLRAVLSMIVNGIAAVVFLIHGGLAWEAVGLLAAGQPRRRLRRRPPGPRPPRTRTARGGRRHRRGHRGEAARLTRPVVSRPASG